MDMKTMETKLIEANAKLLTASSDEVLHREDGKHLLITANYENTDFDSPLDWDWSWSLHLDASTAYDELVTLLGSAVKAIYDNNNNIVDFFKDAKDYAKLKGVLIRPVTKFEHGNVRFYQGDTATGFDSGVCGFAYAKVDQPTADEIYTLDKELDSLLDVYSEWCNGDVFTVTSFDTLEGQEIDSVGGVYGNQLDYIVDEFKA